MKPPPPTTPVTPPPPPRRRRRRPKPSHARAVVGWCLIGAGLIVDGVAAYEGYRAKQKGDQLTSDSMGTAAQDVRSGARDGREEREHRRHRARHRRHGGRRHRHHRAITSGGLRTDGKTRNAGRAPVADAVDLARACSAAARDCSSRRHGTRAAVDLASARSSPFALVMLAGARPLPATSPTSTRRPEVQPGRGREALSGRLQVRHVDAEVRAASGRRRRQAPTCRRRADGRRQEARVACFERAARLRRRDGGMCDPYCQTGCGCQEKCSVNTAGALTCNPPAAGQQRTLMQPCQIQSAGDGQPDRPVRARAGLHGGQLRGGSPALLPVLQERRGLHRPTVHA